MVKLEDIDIYQPYDNFEALMLPNSRHCSLEDIEVGHYLADTGSKIVIIEFSLSVDDEESDDEEDENVTTLTYNLRDYESLTDDLKSAV
jgi:hypothetical protein